MDRDMTDTGVRTEDGKTGVLYTFAGSEFRLQRYLRSGLLARNESAFVPQIEMKKKFHGEEVLVRRALFPGYVFVRSDDFPDLYWRVRRHGTAQFIRLLRTGEHIQRIAPEEEAYLSRLCDAEWMVQSSVGEIINGKLIVSSGPLRGMEEQVVRVDRHKRIAILKVKMLGEEREVVVGLSVVKKR